MKKFLYLFLLLATFAFADIEEYIYYESNPDLNYTLNLNFDKYFDEKLNNFIYLKNDANVRENPNTNAKKIGLAKKDKRYPLVGEVKLKNKQKWYIIEYLGNIAYVESKSALKRAFDWEKSIEKAIKINNFITKALKENKEIYYLHNYNFLDTSTKGNVDKYGNSANQSIRAYFLKNNNYINLQDRALFIIEGKKDDYIIIRTLAYDNQYFRVDKKYFKKLKRSWINKKVNKFIFVDRKSQTQVTIERINGVYNVNAVGYVTTGLSKNVGFVTPYGYYLVAYTRPRMPYVNDEEKDEEKKGKIVGDAKYAIRFSGGAYLHGIPLNYEPKENIMQRKKLISMKLGTYPLSHKCVRNEDDIIKYMYDWINEDNKLKDGFTYPKEPVIIMVE